jgi:tetratricopeptide (TPR) repeat protein
MTESQALERHQLGQELQSTGHHAAAIAELAQAAAWFAAADGERSPDLANILMDSTDSLLALCQYAEAEQTARRAHTILTIIAAQLDAEARTQLLPRANCLLGRSLRELGRYEEASEPLRTAIRESSEDELPTHLNEYGILCKYWGKYDEGERVYLHALALLEGRYGKDSVETATLFHNLGGLEHTRGNFARGEPLARKAYEIRRAALGDGHAATVADAVAWGGLLDGLDRYDESMPIYRAALAYYESHLGPEHFEVAATLNNLGMAQAAQGNRREAQTTMQRCLHIKLKLFGEDHPETRLTRNNLAAIMSAVENSQ